MNVKFDAILGALRESDADGAGITSVDTNTPSNINGLVKGNGSVLSVALAGTDYVAPGGDGAVAVLADLTLSATHLPTMSCTSVAATDVVTFAGRNPTNGEAFYLTAIAPNSLPTGLAAKAFTNEAVGPTVYAINASGATCKFSATRGGAAIDITDGDGIAFNARLASLAGGTIVSGLNITDGAIILVESIGGLGWATASGNIGGSICINGDTTAGRHRKATVENASFNNGTGGNLFWRLACALTVSGVACSGRMDQHHIAGTDLDPANSAPATPGSSDITYSNGAPLTIASILFSIGHGTNTAVDYKLGHRFRITQFFKGA